MIDVYKLIDYWMFALFEARLFMSPGLCEIRCDKSAVKFV